MGLLLLIVLPILAANFGLAYWLVYKILPLRVETRNEKIGKSLILVFVFLLLAFITFYLIITNLRFER